MIDLKEIRGKGQNSVVEHLPSMHEGFGPQLHKINYKRVE
jgi:hypothetical protein